MKIVCMHWVWIGPQLPEARLDAIAPVMEKTLTGDYAGAIWWLKTDDSPVAFERHVVVESRSHDTYVNLNHAPIEGLMGELLNTGSGWKVPVFQVDLSERMKKWQSTHKVPDIHNFVAPRVALSDVVRLKVLAWHPGFYLDFDAHFKPEINLQELIPRLSDVPLCCHIKDGTGGKTFFENDFIWVPPAQQQLMAHLYIHITSNDVPLPVKASAKTSAGMGTGGLATSPRPLPRFAAGAGLMPRTSVSTNPMRTMGEARLGLGAMASWTDLEYNLRGCKPALAECFALIRRLPPEVRRELARKVLRVLRDGIILWRELVVDVVVPGDEGEVRLSSTRAASGGETERKLLDEGVITRIGRIQATGENVWKKLGFDSYQKVMESVYDPTATAEVTALFTDESVHKFFYSWRNPGSEELIAALQS